MFSFVSQHIFTALVFSLLANVCHVSAAPTGWPSSDLHSRDLVARGTPSAPHWVVFGDKYVSGTIGPPPASDLVGYNTFVMSFLTTTGAQSKAQEWTTLDANQISNIKGSFASKGISLMVSAFGYGDNPVTNNKDPVDVANKMAAWVKQWRIDGIDVDWEDFDAINKGDGKAEDWVIAFIKQLRSQLPQGQYIITSAPIAPWFSPSMKGGGWLKVHKAVGSMIDWYNIQFYNQQSEYTTCDGLLTKSSSMYPKTSVFEIAASGVDLNKIVIGKPAVFHTDADQGVVPTNILAQCLSTAKGKGWSAGVMGWQYPEANAAWIKDIRTSSWPV